MSVWQKIFCPSRYTDDKIEELGASVGARLDEVAALVDDVAEVTGVDSGNAVAANLRMMRVRGVYSNGVPRRIYQGGTMIEVEGEIFVLGSSSLLSDADDEFSDLMQRPRSFGFQTTADATDLFAMILRGADVQETLMLRPLFRERYKNGGGVMLSQIVNFGGQYLRENFSSIIFKLAAPTELQAGTTYTTGASAFGMGDAGLSANATRKVPVSSVFEQWGDTTTSVWVAQGHSTAPQETGSALFTQDGEVASFISGSTAAQELQDLYAGLMDEDEASMSNFGGSAIYGPSAVHLQGSVAKMVALHQQAGGSAGRSRQVQVSLAGIDALDTSLVAKVQLKASRNTPDDPNTATITAADVTKVMTVHEGDVVYLEWTVPEDGFTDTELRSAAGLTATVTMLDVDTADPRVIALRDFDISAFDYPQGDSDIPGLNTQEQTLDLIQISFMSDPLCSSGLVTSAIFAVPIWGSDDFERILNNIAVSPLIGITDQQTSTFLFIGQVMKKSEYDARVPYYYEAPIGLAVSSEGGLQKPLKRIAGGEGDAVAMTSDQGLNFFANNSDYTDGAADDYMIATFEGEEDYQAYGYVFVTAGRVDSMNASFYSENGDFYSAGAVALPISPEDVLAMLSGEAQLFYSVDEDGVVFGKVVNQTTGAEDIRNGVGVNASTDGLPRKDHPLMNASASAPLDMHPSTEDIPFNPDSAGVVQKGVAVKRTKNMVRSGNYFKHYANMQLNPFLEGDTEYAYGWRYRFLNSDIRGLVGTIVGYKYAPYDGFFSFEDEVPVEISWRLANDTEYKFAAATATRFADMDFTFTLEDFDDTGAYVLGSGLAIFNLQPIFNRAITITLVDKDTGDDAMTIEVGDPAAVPVDNQKTQVMGEFLSLGFLAKVGIPITDVMPGGKYRMDATFETLQTAYYNPASSQVVLNYYASNYFNSAQGQSFPIIVTQKVADVGPFISDGVGSAISEDGTIPAAAQDMSVNRAPRRQAKKMPHAIKEREALVQKEFQMALQRGDRSAQAVLRHMKQQRRLLA